MKKVLKQIKPHRLIFLIVLLAGNTFAWFIYTSRVDNRISVHVKAWDVVFQAGENEVSSNVDVNISEVYPGMDDYEYNITAYNRSEVPASLTYKLLEANILGTQYVTVEGRAERGESSVLGDPTSAQLIQILENDYPFSISVGVSNGTISQGSGEEEYTISVTWPFEQSNDEEDTSYGILAAQYREQNSTNTSIYIKVKLIITQTPS